MRFFLASFLFVIALPCFFGAAYLYLRRMKRWSRLVGVVTTTDIRSSKHLTVKGHMYYHQIFVVVEYSIRGQSMIRRVNPHTTADDLPLAQKLAASKYAPQSKIAIYYNYADPEEITVRPDEEWEGYILKLGLAGLVMTVLGVLLAL